MSRGVCIAAPSSGAGKTMLTLGILRALVRRGVKVRSAKSGPDYIDPQFHAAAVGTPCITLDAWAMSQAMLHAHARVGNFTPSPNPLPLGERAFGHGSDRRAKSSSRKGVRETELGHEDLLIVEGAMGLFDGAPVADNPMGRGSTADVAAALGLPVILILDIARQGQTAAALVQGLDRFRSDVAIGGVILNRMGSARHGQMIKAALQEQGYAVLGAVPRLKNLETPSRHLGLVQAHERDDLESFLQSAAQIVEEHIDLDHLCALAQPVATGETSATSQALPPPAQRIAIAEDEAFAFTYPHILQGWRQAGAQLSMFSPLADEGPGDVDVVYLPGGYPELHAGFLASRAGFKQAMHKVAASAMIYGECGGFMVLGQGLTLARGERHRMLGLLPVETSFSHPKLHLGYRRLTPQAGSLWQQPLMAHEFHYASLSQQSASAAPLFHAQDSMGRDLGPMGAIHERVMGSFAHLICQQQ